MTPILANIISDALTPLIDLFDAILVAIHSVVDSWGMSIIVLTLLVRAALIPLTLKQIRSMQAMQKFQPEIKALQAKYKDDKQRLNEEMMKLYRENSINPLASCLPLVAQFPVFISLFYLLRIDLKKDICPGVTQYAASIHKSVSQVACHQVPGAKGESFLFIPDLTYKATGAVLVVLIVMYVGSQLGSSLVMTSTMDKTQRNIMLAMPLIFVVFILNFPAGLIVYWITTNLWTVGQQLVVKRSSGGVKPADMAPSAVAARAGSESTSGDTKPTAGGGLMGRLMAASEKAQQNAAAAKSEKAKSQKPAASKDQTEPKGDGDAGETEQSVQKPKGGPPPQRNKKKRTGRRR
jgi:YidC/Oxa1 family membrane protein insertase